MSTPFESSDANREQPPREQPHTKPAENKPLADKDVEQTKQEGASHMKGQVPGGEAVVPPKKPLVEVKLPADIGHLSEMKSAPEVRVKPVIMGGHQIVLYSKALHPQHVEMHGRRTVNGRSYELEAWIMRGSHALRLEANGLCATELVCEFDKKIPTAGIVLMHVVTAEKDVEHRFTKNGVRYVSSIQLETLAPNLYYETYDEYLRLAKENGHLAHTWEQPEGHGLSVLEIDRESNVVTALGYHLMPATGTVVRTQTMFEMNAKPVVAMR
jgi:hypothetical protein